jgi:hypothetical protein
LFLVFRESFETVDEFGDVRSHGLFHLLRILHDASRVDESIDPIIGAGDPGISDDVGAENRLRRPLLMQPIARKDDQRVSRAGARSCGSRSAAAFKPAFLIRPHQPQVAGDIGCEDRREPRFDANWPRGFHGASSVEADPTPALAPLALSKEDFAPEAKRDAPGWRP